MVKATNQYYMKVLIGTSTINEGFSIAMFDSQRVAMLWMAQLV
jgi:hypothetical protein